MDKLERNGNVAVVYSPGFGAGWSTWGSDRYADTLTMDREIAEAVEAGDLERAMQLAKEKCPDAYLGGGDQLEIEWVPKGCRFRVNEYDGSESVEVLTPDSGLLA